MCTAWLAWLAAGALLLVAVAAAALWVIRAGPSCRSHFLDFGRVPRLTFFHSLDSPESQRFEYEWEVLKQRTTAAGLNVSFSLVNVDLVKGLADADKPTPSVWFSPDGSVAARERYTGALTSDALLAFLGAKLGACDPLEVNRGG